MFRHNRCLWLSSVILAVFAVTGEAARADDDLADNQATTGADIDDDDSGGFELHYGAALTSEYIDNGESQSDGNPAVQGYVEASYGILYGGVWASTVDFEDGDDNAEFDLYAGLRKGFGDVEVSLSYVRFLYDQTGDCCGEFELTAEYELAGGLGTEGEVDWDPVGDTVWTEIGVSYEFAPKWQVYSNVGTDFGTEGDDEESGSVRDTVAMEFGVSRSITELTTVSVFYHDSNKNPEGVVATLAYDF